MTEYIKRQMILDAIPHADEDKKISLFGAIADFVILVNEIPTADVKPVVHGYNDNQEYYATDEFRCSVCGLHLEDWIRFDDEGNCYEYEFKYCPNCGAKMDEED